MLEQTNYLAVFAKPTFQINIRPGSIFLYLALKTLEVLKFTHCFLASFIVFGRSIRSQMFFKIGVLKNCSIFKEKHLCWSLFLIKLQPLACNIIKKRLQHKFFSVNIEKFLRTVFSIEHLRWLILFWVDFLSNRSPIG